MGAQARQNRRGNETLQLRGKITHQEKLRDARGTNKPTKIKSTYKQAKPTDRQQTGSTCVVYFYKRSFKNRARNEINMVFSISKILVLF